MFLDLPDRVFWLSDHRISPTFLLWIPFLMVQFLFFNSHSLKGRITWNLFYCLVKSNIFLVKNQSSFASHFFWKRKNSFLVKTVFSSAKIPISPAEFGPLHYSTPPSPGSAQRSAPPWASQRNDQAPSRRFGSWKSWHHWWFHSNISGWSMGWLKGKSTENIRKP